MQRLFLLFVLGLFCVPLFSQSTPTAQQAKFTQLEKKVLEKDDKIEKVIISKDRETPFMITFDLERVDGHSISEAKDLIENFLDIKKDKEKFEYSKTIRMKNDLEYQRFEQFYKGIKVEHGDYVALAKAGQLASLNGEYYDIDNVTITPTISEEAALELAKEAVGGDQFSWDFLLEQYSGVVAPALANRWHKMYEEYSPQTELVIVDDFDASGNNLDLAWKFNVYALSPKTVRDWVYVNAHTGKIMLRDPIIKHLADNDPASATVNTRYSKVQTIHTTEKALTLLPATPEPNPFFDPTLGGPDELLDGRGHVDFIDWLPTQTECYVLIDQTRGGSNTTVETYDMNGNGGVPLSLPIYGFGRSITDDDNVWEDSEHIAGVASATVPSEREYDNDIAWDAHWGASEVYEYWDVIHNRDSYDGNGASIYSFVHIGNAFDNAFWNGSVMSYGDGQSFKPLTSLDVCGHEIGHAVCTFTSNLVYALESGGMNEGFSDIWAACQEYYVIKKDVALGEDAQGLDGEGGYEPFGIGEQIDEAGVGLRRMDNPKRSGDPETYNGEDFTRAEGCTPGLTNDQCGVHSNSGVLNKWFYLLTVGSGAGSGPNAQYAGTGDNADDALADLVDGATITPDMVPYSVTGLGFNLSELIAFGCEVGLTSTATFEEARNVSIQFAKSAYGACSPEEQSTTNAWFAVGVGDAYVDCDENLIMGFSTPMSNAKETVFGVNECEPTKTVQVPIFLNPTVFNTTITIDPTSTAEEGKDFMISGLDIVHDGAQYETRFITVTIIDDGIQEDDETVVLKIDNTITEETFGTHILTITDDDFPPTIGGIVTLYENAMEISGGGVLPPGVTAVNPPGSPNVWTGGAALSTGLADGSGAIVDGQLTAGITVDEYNPNAAADVLLHTIQPIDGRLLQNIKVTFNWGVGGEAALTLEGEEPVDYGELMYSFDGVNFIGTGHRFFKPFGSADAVNGTFSEIITDLGNTQFYIGWRWINDDLGGGPQSFAIGAFDVKAELRGIEITPTSNVEERVDENTTVFFKSYQDGDIIARIANPSVDLGCVEATVVESGTTAQTIMVGEETGNRADKVFEITNDMMSASYDLGLYLTTEELGGLDETTLKIGKIVGDLESPTGIIIDDMTTVEAVGDLGFQFISEGANGAFQGFSTFVLTDIAEVAPPLAVDLLDFNVRLTDKNDALLQWETANEQDLSHYEILRSTNLKDWSSLGKVTATAINHYNYTDLQLNTTFKAGTTVYYQLAMVNQDGSTDLSVIKNVVLTSKGTPMEVYPNPSNGAVTVTFSTAQVEPTEIRLLSITGQLVQSFHIDHPAGFDRQTLDLADLARGVYFLELRLEEGTQQVKVVLE